MAASLALTGLLAAPTLTDAACDVTYRMTTSQTLSTLLMTSDYSAANGEFVGEFGAVECTDLSGSMPIFNDNENAELLGLTFFSFGGFTGPRDLAVCVFEPSGAPPTPQQFVSDIESAGAPNGSPVEGVEVVVSNISCDGVGTTTSTTGAPTTTTTTGASTTTSTMSEGAACGDEGNDGITATDALFALNAAVGLQTCAPCICDVDDSGSVAASDALLLLNAAVGVPVELTCPPCT
jgi:hypothetical protein